MSPRHSNGLRATWRCCCAPLLFAVLAFSATPVFAQVPNFRIPGAPRVSGSANAQETKPPLGTQAPEVERLADGTTRVKLSQQVQPSFHIEPIVHRFAARRGTTIPFRYEIRSLGREMNLSIAAVKLRQDLSGILLHDLGGEVPAEITITSPTKLHIESGQTVYIEGFLEVPLARSNFLSYGILVRDEGVLSKDHNDENSQQPVDGVSAGVKFVTQYVLRLDVETGVKDLTEMSQLALDYGRIESELGRPVVKAILNNPTNYAFECYVRGAVNTDLAKRATTFRTSMPSRASVDDDTRHLVRILPHSRVEVLAPIEEVLLPGKQSLEFEITNGRRVVSSQQFALSVQQGDFPALETQQAYLGSQVSVSPAQAEISNEKGGKRTCTFRLHNNSTTDKIVSVDCLDLNGRSIEAVRLSSREFTLKAGRSKSIRASVSGGRNFQETIFGKCQFAVRGVPDQLNVSEQLSKRSLESTSLPVAIVFGERPKNNIEIGELESVVKDGSTQFRLEIVNRGDGYVPVHGQLTLSRRLGGVVKMADGYGRWMEPGEARELRFVPTEQLPSGRYQLEIQVETSPESKRYQRSFIVELGEKRTTNI